MPVRVLERFADRRQHMVDDGQSYFVNIGLR
jgi:hypothetical protein